MKPQSLIETAPRNARVDRVAERWEPYGFAWVLALSGLLTIVRYLGLHWSQVDLFFDESQYWSWSREFAFGYFSKPPLLAWMIAATTAVCGDGEACVRAAAPLSYFILMIAAYAVTRLLYGARTAFWTAIILGLIPGIAFSSRIISTDVPLLLLWTVALLCFVGLRREPNWRLAIGLGCAFGLGMLSKYAMAYFLLGVVLAALIDSETRQLLRRPHLYVALAIGILLLLPNLIWNLHNGLVTLKATGDNIQGDGLRIRPLAAIEFIAAQFGILGPFLFGAFLVAVARLRSPAMLAADRVLVAFALPPLVIITVLAVVRGANANWAATGLLSAGIVATALLIRLGCHRMLLATVAIGVVAQVALLIGDAMPYRVGIPALGAKGDLYRRTLGWRGLGAAVSARATQLGVVTVLGEGRDELASLVYYMRDAGQWVLAWPNTAEADNTFDLSHPVRQQVATPALFVSVCPSPERLRPFFSKVQPVEPLSVASGPTTSRVFFVTLVDGQTRPTAPIGPCR